MQLPWRVSINSGRYNPSIEREGGREASARCSRIDGSGPKSNGPDWVVCHELRLNTTVRNCTRDEGGPFEAGSQVLASNHCKLLSPKAMVVSVAVNVGTRSRRVRLREASASEPSMKCRKRIRRCQNRGVTLPPGSARENPEACPSGIRHVGGAKLNQALVRNVRTCRSDAKGDVQAAHTARARVPKRSTGAEQLVVGMKAL